jgi:hypothetical protein
MTLRGHWACVDCGEIVEEQEREPDDDGWRETNSFDFTDLETVATALEMAKRWIKNELMTTI